MSINIAGSTITSNDVREYEYDAIIQNGLVLHLDGRIFNTVSGTTWYDLSGNGNNGTLTNGTSFNSTGQGSLNFDGSNDIVTLGYRPSLLPSTITQEAWVRADSFVNWHGIISNMPSWGTGFSLQIGTTQRIAAMVSGAYLTTSWTPSINTWYHIAATHDSNDLNILYVNGIQENSLTRSISYTANAVTTIGAFYTSPSLFLDGLISQVRTYNRALTQSEIQNNYNLTKYRYGL